MMVLAQPKSGGRLDFYVLMMMMVVIIGVELAQRRKISTARFRHICPQAKTDKNFDIQGINESKRQFKEILGLCLAKQIKAFMCLCLNKEIKDLAKKINGLADKEFKDLAKEINGLDKEIKGLWPHKKIEDLLKEIRGLCLAKKIKDLAKEIKGLVDKELGLDKVLLTLAKEIRIFLACLEMMASRFQQPRKANLV
ncbi:hypothetical protein GPALN_006943 [Globodera pallida]|nr:hypothetical protein GPALN_006943 [Globodera pallida]